MPINQPQAILLDLDDTIIDYGGSAAAAWATVAAEAARVVGIDAAALLDEIHRMRDWFWSDAERHREGRADLRTAWARIVTEALARFGVTRPDVAGATADAYRDLRTESIRLFPGSIDALQRLRGLGLPLGMVTNGTSADQRAKIERFGLAPYFEHILIEGEFGCGKPDGRVYRAAVAALGSAPRQTWFVGDNLEWDVAAPQREGLYGVWVDREQRGLRADAPAQPQRIIHALPALPELL